MSQNFQKMMSVVSKSGNSLLPNNNKAPVLGGGGGGGGLLSQPSLPFKSQLSVLSGIGGGPDNTNKIIEQLGNIFEDLEKPQFEKLKETLELMVGEIKNAANRAHQVDTKLVSKFMIFEKTRNDMEEIKKEIIAMKLVSQELDGKTTQHDNDLSVIKTDIEATKMNFQLMQRRYNEIPMRVSDLEDAVESLKTGFLQFNSQPKPSTSDNNNSSSKVEDGTSTNDNNVNTTTTNGLISSEVFAQIQQQLEDMKTQMNKRFETELLTVNESITRLHEQSLSKMRNLKRELKSMKVIEVEEAGDEKSGTSHKLSKSINVDFKEVEDNLMIKMKEYLRRLLDQQTREFKSNRDAYLDLERQIRILNGSMQHNNSVSFQKDTIESHEELGGLSTKKKSPIGGGIPRAGSQQKSAIDMFGVQGRRLEFPKHNYPFRDGSQDGNNVPNRLPKVGKGFSKILSSISPIGVKSMGQAKAHQTIQQLKMPQLVGSGSQNMLFQQTSPLNVNEDILVQSEIGGLMPRRLLEEPGEGLNASSTFAMDKFSKSPQNLRGSNNLDFPYSRERNHNSSVISNGSSNSANNEKEKRLSDVLHLPTPYSRNPHYRQGNNAIAQSQMSPSPVALSTKKQQTLSLASQSSSYNLEQIQSTKDLNIIQRSGTVAAAAEPGELSNKSSSFNTKTDIAIDNSMATHHMPSPNLNAAARPPLKIGSQKQTFIRKLQKKGVFQQDVLSMSAQHITIAANAQYNSLQQRNNNNGGSTNKLA